MSNANNEILLAMVQQAWQSLPMNKLTSEDRARVISCLAEGSSTRATVRMTGIAKDNVTKLLVDTGNACSAYQDKIMRNLKCKRIQCDEILEGNNL